MNIRNITIGWSRFCLSYKHYDGFWSDAHWDCCGYKDYGFQKLGFYFVWTRRK